MKGPSLAHWCSGVTHPFTGTANPSGHAVCAPLPMPGSPSDLGGGAAQPSNQSKKTRGGCRAPAPRERTPSIICKRPRSRFSYGSCLVAYEWVGLVRLVHCQFGTHVCLALSPSCPGHPTIPLSCFFVCPICVFSLHATCYFIGTILHLVV